MTARTPARLIAGSLAALITLGLAPAAANAAPPPYRQLIGVVNQPGYFEASVPDTADYRLEYDTTGVAFFDTYVDGTELGYVGGPAGSYQTRIVQLSAGGHLVQVVGPEGNGTARVYLVSAV
jgi:hypothetical protein